MFINGPINIITIEDLNNTKLTFIADIHQEAEKQTECKELKNIELSQYLLNIFEQYNNPTSLHFYIETIPPNHNGCLVKRKRYADSVINMLLKSFTPTKSDDGILYKSNKFNNILLHFIDIRDMLFPSMDNLFNSVSDSLTELSMTLNVNNSTINKLYTSLQNINTMMRFTFSTLYDKVHVQKQINNSNKLEVYKEMIKRILNKIRNDYKDENTKNIIKTYIDNQFINNFKKFFEYYDELMKYKKKLEDIVSRKDKLNTDELDGAMYDVPYIELKEVITRLDTMVYKFNHTWFVELTSKIMDLYVIRNILNNNVDRAILYTGIEHTMFFIYFFVKYFNFRVSKVSKINGITVDTLNKQIKEGEYRHFHKYLFPPILEQCSNDNGMYNFIEENQC